jgi:hypothetical protein
MLSTDVTLNLVYLRCCLSIKAPISSPSEELLIDLKRESPVNGQ